MLARTRFSGAFGADAATAAAHLLTAEETAGRWATPADPGAALAYLRAPGAPCPRHWQDPTGQVTLFADARLWDGAPVRATLRAAGARLQSEDDGETLLALYLRHGVAFGRHCRGMFAAAIVDLRQPAAPRLVLARDPLGGRGALYYARRGNTIACSSTLRSLRRWPAIPLEPNLAAVRQYLTYAFVPGAETLLADCREVLPGQTVTALLDPSGHLTLTGEAYWSPEESTWDDDAPVERFATPLRRLLEEAVAERHPGGPVAVLLSGGLDSSAVTALAARHGAPLHTFSISFGAQYRNELAFSGLVADHCRTRHTILTVTGREIARHLAETTARLDGPIGDPLTVPNLLLARAASRVSDVILNGEGGDPCFGGPKNPAMFLHELYAGDDPFARERSYLRSYQKCYDDLPRLLAPRVRAALAAAPPQEAFLTPYFAASGFARYLNQLMNINVRLKGSHQILYKVDRMSAAWGLEGRSPLFDRRVVEFSFGIPPRWKRSGQEEKYVLKRAVRDLLPEAILARPKSGMLVPVQGWFRDELRGLAREHLLGRRARRRDLLDQSVVREWLDYRDSLYPRHGIKLWLLLALELYWQAFLDAPRSAPVLPVPDRGL